MSIGAVMSQPDNGGNSDLMNYLVRMVVPMRREFGRQLDVRHFLHDLEYAREVVREALTSQDPRLLQYAQYVGDHHLGPRNASNPSPARPNAAAKAAEPAAAGPPAAGEPTNLTAAEMRERVLRKYTSGLR
jgi:hypothetical protein